MGEKSKTKPNDGRRSCLHMMLTGIFLAFAVFCVVPVALITVAPVIDSLDSGQCRAALTEMNRLSSPAKIINIPDDIAADLQPIHAGNATKMQAITHFGRGTIYDAFWNKAGDLLVLTSLGLWRHSKTHLFDPPELLWTQPSVFYHVPAVSPDGSYFALSVFYPNPIAVYDTATGEYQRLHTERDFPSGPERMVFSPDGQRLALSDREKISIWDIAADEKVMSFPKITDYIEGMAFSPDSGLLAVAGRDYHRNSDPELTPKIRVWNLYTGEQTLEITPAEGVFGVAFHPDGSRLMSMVSTSLTTAVNLRVQSWWLSSGELVQDEPPQMGGVPIVYSANGHYVAFGGNVYDVQTNEILTSHPPLGGFHVAFSSDSKWMVLVDHPANNRVYVASLGNPADYQPIMAYSEDYDFDQIKFRSSTEIAGYAKPTELMLLRDDYPVSDRITLNPDRTRFMLLERRFGVNDDMVVRLCATASGNQVAFLHSKTTPIFSHSGQYLVTTGECNVLEVRDGVTAQPLRTFGQCDKLGHIQSMAFGSDDTLLALTRWNVTPGTIELIRFDTGQIIQTLHQTDWLIGGLAFNETGTLLASASQDGTLRLWGVPSDD